jgi:hypothetical protein
MTQILAPALSDHGTVGTGTSTIELADGLYHRITLSAASRTIAAPIVGVNQTSEGPVNVPVSGPAGPQVGTMLFVEIKNASGGVVTVTWNAAFKGAPANPATGTRRVHQFVYDGTNWVLMANGADVAN